MPGSSFCAIGYGHKWLRREQRRHGEGGDRGRLVGVVGAEVLERGDVDGVLVRLEGVT